MTLAVSELGYSSAVESLVSGNELAAQTATRLAGRRRGYGEMAGDDSTATDFAASYDEGAGASIEALESVVGAFGALGKLVEASLSNHAHADARSTLPGWARSVVGPPTVADRAVGVLLAAPPSSLGADSGGPGGAAGLVLDVLQDVFWPSADTDRVRAAGAAWTSAGQGVGLLSAHCDSALRSLDGERSPEVPVAIAVIRDVRARVEELAAQFDALGAACYEYADHVDTKRSELLSLLEDLAVEIGVGAVIAGGLSIISGGAAAGAAGGAGAARLAAAGARARGILDSLRVLAGGTALGVRPVAVTAGEASATFGRISRARVMLMEAGGQGGHRARNALEGAEGWFARQARAGGHIWERHGAKTNAELRERLVSDPKIQAASTFPDKATAHRAVLDLLNSRRREIDAWLSGSRGAAPIQGTLDYTVGRTMSRSGEVSDVNTIRAFLIRDARQPEGFRVHTAYPTKG
jgi:hypothetical protein